MEFEVSPSSRLFSLLFSRERKPYRPVTQTPLFEPSGREDWPPPELLVPERHLGGKYPRRSTRKRGLPRTLTIALRRTPVACRGGPCAAAARAELYEHYHSYDPAVPCPADLSHPASAIPLAAYGAVDDDGPVAGPRTSL